jgi:transcription initiation factor IIE alpha subunit
VASIDLAQVTKDVLGAMTTAIGSGSGQVHAFARAEAAKIAVSIAEIGQLRAAGVIDEEEMELHLDVQKNASRAVLMAVKGIGIVTAERAVNAAISVALAAVSTSLGVPFVRV